MPTRETSWRCAACGAYNASAHDECEGCGLARSRSAPPSASEQVQARRCPVDGGPLEAIGWCERGQGYPAGMVCPFACPLCRQALTWDGRCFACYGCTTGRREDWTIPGDRYELAGGHWRKVEGPQACLSADENRARLTSLVRELADRLAPVSAQTIPAAPDLGW